MGVQIHRIWGAAEANTADVTSINSRLNAEEAHSTNDTDNPILIPASGTNYSYWAIFRLYFDGTGTGTINNLKWFTDGANGLGTGVTLKVAMSDVYERPTGTEGTTGDQLAVNNWGNNTDDLTSPANAFTYTTGSPLSVAGTVTDPTDEYFGDYVVLQTEVADTASAGATPTETITWRYDSTVSE